MIGEMVESDAGRVWLLGNNIGEMNGLICQ